MTTIIGTKKDDTIVTGSGSDNIDGGSGDDAIKADAGNDTVEGGEGDDKISGGDGDDILVGRGGQDVLSGGAGDDVFAYLNLGDGADRILDYNAAEDDKLDLSAMLDSGFAAAGSRVEDFVQLTQSGSDISIPVDVDGAANGADFAPVIVLVGCATLGDDPVMAMFGSGTQTMGV
ncbi:Leukotoxin [compost metagenome]